jgi:DNA-binding response OmpR family regulator
MTQLNGLTILVVDYDADTVAVLAEYLESAGARVIGVNSAKAALDVTRTVQVDAILIELHMPAEGGEWFVRQFRTPAEYGAPPVPVFAMTWERHDRPGAESGFIGSFVKPVDVDMVLAIIAALQRRAP